MCWTRRGEMGETNGRWQGGRGEVHERWGEKLTLFIKGISAVCDAVTEIHSCYAGPEAIFTGYLEARGAIISWRCEGKKFNINRRSLL